MNTHLSRKSRVLFKGLWQGSAPADEYPSHHDEDLAPGVHQQLLVRVGFARILHRVVAPPAIPEHGLLSKDDEQGAWEGEAQRLPTPVRADVEGKSNEEKHKRQGVLVLALHVARVQVLLDEDASVHALDDAVDEHDNTKGGRGDRVVGRKEAGEAKSRPGHNERPWRLQEEAKVGSISSKPPPLEDGTLLVLSAPRSVQVVGVVEEPDDRDHATSSQEGGQGS